MKIERASRGAVASFRSFQSHSLSGSKFLQQPETHSDWLQKGEIKTTVNFWPHRNRGEERPSLYPEWASPSSSSSSTALLSHIPTPYLDHSSSPSFHSHLFTLVLLFFSSQSSFVFVPPPNSIYFQLFFTVSPYPLMNLRLAAYSLMREREREAQSRKEQGEGYRVGGDCQRWKGGDGKRSEKGRDTATEDMGREGQEKCRILDCVMHKLCSVREKDNPKRSECINRNVTVALTKICWAAGRGEHIFTANGFSHYTSNGWGCLRMCVWVCVLLILNDFMGQLKEQSSCSLCCKHVQYIDTSLQLHSLIRCLVTTQCSGLRSNCCCRSQVDNLVRTGEACGGLNCTFANQVCDQHVGT